ncbi:MAG: aspartate/glutamate racemase family protein [Gaiellaceae bacterium]
MHTIGLLGGMSSESSVEYYRLLNELVRDRLGGLHSARCVMLSVDFAGIDALMREGLWDEAGETLATDARRIEAAGAELLLLCTNTLHRVAPAIESVISIPFLHIADAAARCLREAGVSKVGLLGTAFTMEQAFYRERLEGHGLEVLVPMPGDRAELHRIIFEELCEGHIEPSSRDTCRRLIADLGTRGAEGILLACTELGLLITPGDSPLPLFDTTRIHVEAAVELALSPEGAAL